jgi:hypothetical protein
MSVFAPEMSLVEVIARVRRTLKASLDVEHAHILLHDATSGHFVLMPHDAPATSSTSVLSLVERLGGSIASSGLFRLLVEKCGALAQAIATGDIVAINDTSTAEQFVSGETGWKLAHALLDQILGIAAGTASFLVAPVILGSSHIAALIFVTNKRAPHEGDDGDGSRASQSGPSSASTPTGSRVHEADYSDWGAMSDDESGGVDHDVLEEDLGDASPDARSRAAHGWHTSRRVRYLTSMRTWSLQRKVGVKHTSGTVDSAAGKRLSFSVVNPLSKALALVPHDVRRGVVLGKPPPTRIKRHAKAAAYPFSDRDVRVVAGVAAELALSLEDRMLECSTLIGEREYTVVAALRDFVRVHVDLVSGVEVPANASVYTLRPASHRDREGQKLTHDATGGSPASAHRVTSYAELVNGTTMQQPVLQRSAGCLNISLLLVHGSQVLSATVGQPAELVRRG